MYEIQQHCAKCKYSISVHFLQNLSVSFQYTPHPHQGKFPVCENLLGNKPDSHSHDSSILSSDGQVFMQVFFPLEEHSLVQVEL